MNSRLVLFAQLFWLRSIVSTESLVAFESLEDENAFEHATFLRGNYVAMEPVNYWGIHPYESMQKSNTTGINSRDLQYNTNDQYRNMVISFQNDALYAYSNANPSKAAIISYVTTMILPKAASFWSSALKVYPTKSYTVANPCNLQGIATVSNIDLAVFTIADEPNTCTSDNVTSTLAAAYTGRIDQYGRPTVGCMIICTSGIDLNNEASKAQALDTVIHEFAHMLGFNSDLFAFFVDPATGKQRTPNKTPQSVLCVDGISRSVVLPANNTIILKKNSQGVRLAEIVTPTIQNIVRSQFDCMNATGARLENQLLTDNDCFGSHWEARLFQSEMMTAVTTGIKRYISPLTLAYFEDTGWYRPNYNVAKISPFGRGAGCKFIDNACIVNGNVPSYSQDSFCIQSQRGCDPSLMIVSACSVASFTAPLPDQYQYFPNPNVGGFLSTVDYCPIYSPMKFYGSTVTVDCTNRTIQDYYNYVKLTYSYETFGPDARCYLSSAPRSVCLKTFCNMSIQKVQFFVGAGNYTCEYAGQVISIQGSSTKIACPALSKMCPDAVCPGNCAGRGLCDYGLEQCVCFNSSDTSSMCLNSPKFGNVTISNHSQSIPVPSLGVPAQQPLSSSGEKMRFDFINAYFILCTCVIMLRMIWD